MAQYETLQDVQRELEVFSKLNTGLSGRINRSKEKLATQESLKNLLKYEQSRLISELDKLDKDNSELMLEQEHLSKTVLEKRNLLKHFEHLNEVNTVRIDIKERTLDKLQALSETLDFELEKRAIGGDSDD